MSRINNKVTLVGHLGDDIKMHYFDGSGCVGNVSLATNLKYKKQSGEEVNTTEWHNLVFRNKSAETAEKWTKKGSKLMVEGRLTYRKWTDDKGIERYTTQIAVNDFMFLDAKGETREPQPPPQNPGPTTSAAQQTGQPAESLNEEDHDDLPF